MARVFGRALPTVVLYATVTLLLGFNALYLLAHYYGYTGGGAGTAAVVQYPLYSALIVFGDSITQGGNSVRYRGFVARLTDIYTRRMDVLNRGFSGYNTRNALSVADKVFPIVPPPSARSAAAQRLMQTSKREPAFPGRARAPRLCLIFFGANDARAAQFAQHVPLDEFRANLLRLIALLRNPASQHYSPDTRILLITPPAVGDRMMDEIERRDGHHPGWRNDVTKQYADAVKEVAEVSRLPVIDLWTWIEDLVHGTAESDPLALRLPEDSAKYRVEGDDDDDDDADKNWSSHTLSTTQAASGTNQATNGTSPFEGYERFLSDGLHLNAGGNELLFKLTLAKVMEEWPDMKPRWKSNIEAQIYPE
ncbi:isoamyl acetate-hydrolyzing esterase [Coemansia biformis]|uniref:Isoamyl acetate-hydrolyzing esterase n=1 Tax=Coemansia biformis TaxID=1286918 RepID=A0A9W8CUY3_9FUNG|nr:isoamyl acetate-hydrolyzing esterase [Coemansia biformis]